MNSESVNGLIAIGSFIISAATFVVMLWKQRKTAKVDYVSELETRVAYLEKHVAALEEERDKLFRENMELYRRLGQMPPQ